MGNFEITTKTNLQVLSIRPDFKDLWFNCGQKAIILRDWQTAEFCFIQCIDELRALEGLLFVHFLSKDFQSLKLYNLTFLKNFPNNRLV